jgi:hypothetical protein
MDVLFIPPAGEPWLLAPRDRRGVLGFTMGESNRLRGCEGQSARPCDLAADVEREDKKRKLFAEFSENDDGYAFPALAPWRTPFGDGYPIAA